MAVLVVGIAVVVLAAFWHRAPRRSRQVPVQNEFAVESFTGYQSSDERRAVPSRWYLVAAFGVSPAAAIATLLPAFVFDGPRDEWLSYVAFVAPAIIFGLAALGAAIRPIAAFGLMVYVWVATAIWIAVLLFVAFIILAALTGGG
jgi:hypothetical protein